MKTLKIFLAFIGLLLYTNIQAGEVISVYVGINNAEWVEDKRSVSLTPTAFLDGNTITIYTNAAAEVQAFIKDSMGNIIYSDNSMTLSRRHTLDISNLPKGKYSFELIIGEGVYYGNFTI